MPVNELNVTETKPYRPVKPELAQFPEGGLHCEVLSCVSGLVHFVACHNFIRCSKQMFFGNACVCTNPVRKDVYNRLGI